MFRANRFRQCIGLMLCCLALQAFAPLSPKMNATSESGSMTWQVDERISDGGARIPEGDMASSTCTSETEWETAEEADEAVIRTQRSHPGLVATSLLAARHPIVTGITHVPPLNPPEVL